MYFDANNNLLLCNYAGQQRDEAFRKTLFTTLTYATKVYDTITLPFYAAVQQPWKKLAMNNAPKVNKYM